MTAGRVQAIERPDAAFLAPAPIYSGACFFGPLLQPMPIAGSFGQLFDPAQGGMQSCLLCTTEAGVPLQAAPLALRDSQGVVLSVQSTSGGVLAIDLSATGQSWARAAWFAIEAGPEAVLRFRPSLPHWRPSVTTDADASLSVFAQARTF